MSFTCPECFWTSHNPNDEANSYCGHCRRHVERAADLTAFQHVAVKALLHTDPWIAETCLLAAVAQRRMQLETFEQISVELGELLTGRAIPATWLIIIEKVQRRIRQATGDGLTYPPLE